MKDGDACFVRAAVELYTQSTNWDDLGESTPSSIPLVANSIGFAWMETLVILIGDK